MGRKLEQDLVGRVQMRTLSLFLQRRRKATAHELVIDALK